MFVHINMKVNVEVNVKGVITMTTPLTPTISHCRS